MQQHLHLRRVVVAALCAVDWGSTSCEAALTCAEKIWLVARMIGGAQLTEHFLAQHMPHFRMVFADNSA